MTRLLGEVFSRRDPPAVAAGVTASEFEALVRLFCPRAEDQGLTIVARLADTGELVGALLTEDSALAPPDGMDRLSTKFDPIFDNPGPVGCRVPGRPDGAYGRVAAPVFSGGRRPKPPEEGWRGNSSRLVSRTARKEGIGWRSPKPRTRCRNISSADSDSWSACGGLTRPITSSAGPRLPRSPNTGVPCSWTDR